MGLVTDLNPTNVKTERELFEADNSYNPQFEYVREFSDEELTQYGLPDERFFEHAERMLTKFGVPKPSTVAACTPEEIEEEVHRLYEELGLPIVPVRFSKRINSQVTFSKKAITFRLPIKYGLASLHNKLNHEIQTHYLRKYNQQQQTWNMRSERKDPNAFRTTEEGLANLHSYIKRPDPTMRKTFINYYAAYMAQYDSFSELYKKLIELGASERLAWNLTIKQKRGLKDTGRPGGWSKNHVYFEGTIKVWNWLMTPGNNPQMLYRGRITIKDVAKIESLPSSSQIIYPTFLKDTNKYLEQLRVIGEVNELSSLPIL